MPVKHLIATVHWVAQDRADGEGRERFAAPSGEPVCAAEPCHIGKTLHNEVHVENVPHSFRIGRIYYEIGAVAEVVAKWWDRSDHLPGAAGRLLSVSVFSGFRLADQLPCPEVVLLGVEPFLSFFPGFKFCDPVMPLPELVLVAVTVNKPIFSDMPLLFPVS